MFGPEGGGGGVGAPEGVLFHFRQIEAVAVGLQAAHLDHVALDLDPRCQAFQDLTRDAARRDARCGFAGRGAAAAARVAQPVFLPIGDVGVAGAEGLGDVAVIFRPLVGILDHQLDRCAGGAAFVDA